MGTADAFFEKGPWSLDVPANVSRECFEVILVDAPQGYRPDLPGGWPLQGILRRAAASAHSTCRGQL